MSARSRVLATGLGLLLGLLRPLTAPAAADDEGPALRWVWDGERAGVEVLGLRPLDLARLARADPAAAAWPALLTVGVEPKPDQGSGPGTPPAPLRPIAGRYWVDGSTLRFEPRYPTDRAVALVARFDPAQLADPIPGPVRTARLALRPPPRVPTARVSRVDPTADLLPENLLKFYLTFTNPMSRGEAYRRVHLVEASGRPLVAPFLEVGEELWNDAGTRLTLLLDPGRIKRGLVPNLEDGPILKAGQSYRLTVDRDWPDAEGCPLVAGFTRTFRAGPADRVQPDPRGWTIQPPAAHTREPLTLAFPEALDHALLATALVVVGPDGQPIPGRVAVAPDGRGWSLRPEADWVAGDYRVAVNPDLEDLAGNSVARPFEVDLVPPASGLPASGPVVLPFTVRERPDAGPRG